MSNWAWIFFVARVARRRSRVAARLFRGLLRRIGGRPPPRQKVCKVFERKEFSLDFVLVCGAKVESPACAGLWFLPDLIVAGVSRVGGGDATEGPNWVALRGLKPTRLISPASANARAKADPPPAAKDDN